MCQKASAARNGRPVWPEKNKSLPFITGLGAAVNVVVNLLLIPTMGIMGAAIATLAAYMVMAFAIYRVSQEAYPIRYDWSRIVKLFLLVGIAYGAERFFVLGNIISSGVSLFLLRIGLTIAVIGSLFLFGFFSDREKDFLKSVGRRFGL